MTPPLLNQKQYFPNWLMEWWPVLLGIVTLYVPTYYGLSTGIWGGSDQAHGPIVLMVVLFLFWQNREQLQFDALVEPWPILGSVILVLGILCYVIGRSQDILMLDIGSQILVFSGILLLTRGMPALKAMWFPSVLYSIHDTITGDFY